MDNDLISIIVPVYNAQEYLEKCLDSLIDQSYKNIEVICINDGSRDQSESILLKYQEKHPSIFVVKTIENAGQANARNLGLELAKGTYICFVDSDDYIDKKILEKLYFNMKANNSDLSFCDIERIFEGKMSLLERSFKYDIQLDFNGVTTIYDKPEIICYMMNAPYAKLIKKQFLVENNISFIKGYIYEDLVFTQEILAANPAMSMVKEKLYKYIVRNNSTMTSKKSKVSDMFVSYKNVYQAYQKRGITNTFREELEYLCLYHVMIGTSYRMWRSRQYTLRESMKICRKYVNNYKCRKSNKYIKAKGILAIIFVKLVLIKGD